MVDLIVRGPVIAWRDGGALSSERARLVNAPVHRGVPTRSTDDTDVSVRWIGGLRENLSPSDGDGDRAGVGAVLKSSELGMETGWTGGGMRAPLYLPPPSAVSTRLSTNRSSILAAKGSPAHLQGAAR